MIKSKKSIYILIFICALILGVIFLKKDQKIKPIFDVTDNQIKFNNQTLETKQSLARLFIQKPLEKDVNAKYYYSVFNDLKSNQEFVRVDKKVIQTGTVWFDNVSAFYIYDSANGQYKKVLVSSEKQNNARFPQTQIVNPDELTVKFYYDISRPDQCYGFDCRAYRGDFYKWDDKKSEFELVNKNYQSFYTELLKQYDRMDSKGCVLGDIENRGLKTLEAIYEFNKSDYCQGSSREELNKFFQTKNEIEEIF